MLFVGNAATFSCLSKSQDLDFHQHLSLLFLCSDVWINVRETRRSNQEWTINRHRQHSAQDTEQKQTNITQKTSNTDLTWQPGKTDVLEKGEPSSCFYKTSDVLLIAMSGKSLVGNREKKKMGILEMNISYWSASLQWRPSGMLSIPHMYNYVLSSIAFVNPSFVAFRRSRLCSHCLGKSTSGQRSIINVPNNW